MNRPAALKAGIIVAAKANQNPPVSVSRDNQGVEALSNAGELTNGTEYNAGERIANHELKDTSYEQQKATKKDDRAAAPLIRSRTRS